MKTAAEIVDLIDQEMGKHLRRKSHAAASLAISLYRAAVEDAIGACTIGEDGATESVSLDDLRKMLDRAEAAQWAVVQASFGGD